MLETLLVIAFLNSSSTLPNIENLEKTTIEKKLLVAHSNKSCGQATYYDPWYHNRTTSNGDIYNRYGLSAALADDLPFGRYKVTHKGRSVIVKGNDRGAFSPRIADLSEQAFIDLAGSTEKGVIHVCLERL